MRYFLYLSLLLTMILYPVNAFNAEEMTLSPINYKIEMLNWDQVNKIIPKYSKFKVIDYETGEIFSVQRRAGSKHADVQPLTKADTEIFKKIYKGSWSWNRRAAFVLVNGQLIAASMHGMPHGAGALKNGFPGHFCIHFLESTTHGSHTPDLGHQLMVFRAAGQLDQYLQDIPSHDVVNVMFTALKNSDYRLLEDVVYLENNKNIKDELREIIDNIEGIQWKMNTANYKNSDLLSLLIPIEVAIYVENKGLRKASFDLHLWRNSILDRWKVDANPIIQLVQN